MLPTVHPTSDFPYRRAMIIGCPGSGKSTFARLLRDVTGLPLHHLDAIFWKPDRTTLKKEEFRAIMRKIIETDAWIIDGHYASTLEWRLSACDVVFFLDYPTEVCLEGIRTRRGHARSDIPWIETEDDAEFLDFIQKFHTESKPQVLEQLAQFPNKPVFRFCSREEANNYLASLQAHTPFSP